MCHVADNDRHEKARNGGHHVGDANQGSGVVTGQVRVIGEDAGKHGSKEHGPQHHQNDHNQTVAASQANPNQTSRRQQGRWKKQVLIIYYTASYSEKVLTSQYCLKKGLGIGV